MSELASPEPKPLAPPIAVAAFIACIAGAAALADCALLAALLKRRIRTGLFSVIIQLAIADCILLGTTVVPELWSLNLRTWQFGTSGCVAYQGLNVFSTTLCSYLQIAIVLHTLTAVRLEEKITERRMKRNSRNEDEEIRSSQHSLVANSDSSTPPRTMNVDYRVSDTRLPAALPSIFVWILAVCLSVPEFVLAGVVRYGKNVSICTLDFNHRLNVQTMLAVFNLFLPLFIISIAGSLVIVKLKTKKKVVSSALDSIESKASLKLSLWLVCVYVLLCAPRLVVRAYRVYSSSINSNESALDVYLDSDTAAIVHLMLSSGYLVATVIRPLLCITILPQIRIIFELNSRISNV